MPASLQAVMQVSAICGVDTAACQASPNDGHGDVKNRNRPDGCWHDQGDSGVLLDGAFECDGPEDQSDEHTAGVAEEHASGGKL